MMIPRVTHDELTRLRPFRQRLINSYRGWRLFGLSRAEALRAAWQISRAPVRKQ